jgi:hypothetical protein
VARLFHVSLTGLAAAACLASAPGAFAATSYDAAFFSNLPQDYRATVETCADVGRCAGIDSLNRGPQLYSLTVWRRPVSDALAVEIVGDHIMTDARMLADLIDGYYRWPAEVPRRGVVDIRSLPGLSVERDGMTVALEPQSDYAVREPTGDSRRVDPADFTTPGTGIFGGFNVTAGYDEQFGIRGRFNAVFGAQMGLWQAHGRGSIDFDGGNSVLDYAYVDSPILSRAARFQAGYMSAFGTCFVCANGRMLGLSLASDSLGGMLYDTADTAYLDILVDGPVSQIEIVVNGRTLRRETAFPGPHTIAVSPLEDGPNFIEIYGIAGGERRLLATTQKTASSGALAEGRAENRVQAGWLLGRDDPRLYDPLAPLSLDYVPPKYDYDFWAGTPFLQLETRRGLGGGRELSGSLVLTGESAAIESSLRFRLGSVRTTLTGIGSFGEGVPGGGMAMRLDRAGRTSFALTGRVCFDCYDIITRGIADGLRYNVGISASRGLGSWSAGGSVNVSNEPSYYRYDGNTVTLRADLRRPLLGGQVGFYVLDSFGFGGGGRPQRLAAGLTFARMLGGERVHQFDVGLDGRGDRLTAHATYTNTPADNEGFYGSATIESPGTAPYYSHDDFGLSGTLGYRGPMATASLTAARRYGRSRLDVSLGSGFAFIDGQLVVTNQPESGGAIAGGLAPGSSIFVADQERGKVNRLGGAHVYGIGRGRISLDEGVDEDGAAGTREADLTMIPGRYYAIGPDFAAHETSYLIGVGREMTPPPPGLALFDGRGETVGYTGYEGVTTISGPPDGIAYDDGFETCTLAATGDDVPGSLVRQLRATCVANAAPRIAPVPPATAPRLPPEIAGAEPEGQREASLADRF